MIDNSTGSPLPGHVPTPFINGGFDSYWNQGKAELTSFDLTQARYGELHEGEAVIVFVTEPFSKSKQVKLDQPSNDGDSQEVLKMNFTRKFNTGIYPYSMMTSTFTPTSVISDEKKYAGNPFKVTTSSQEWCGHTFTQLNKSEDGYSFKQFSYFESEGDDSDEIDNSYVEDGMWAMVRLNPASVPKGNFTMIPSTQFLRLSHQEMQSYECFGNHSFSKTENAYSFHYPGINRRLVIITDGTFPYAIKSFTEEYTSGWGVNAKTLKTEGIAKASQMLDYWNLNRNQDAHYRDDLKLD